MKSRVHMTVLWLCSRDCAQGAEKGPGDARLVAITGEPQPSIRAVGTCRIISIPEWASSGTKPAFLLSLLPHPTPRSPAALSGRFAAASTCTPPLPPPPPRRYG